MGRGFYYQFRRNTRAGAIASQVTSGSTPVLGLAEPGFETDTNMLKIGDGVMLLRELPYLNWGTIRKDADQNSIGSSATDISDLSVDVLNGQTLRFKAFLRTTSSSAILGAMISCNGPTTSKLCYQTIEWTASGTPSYNHHSAYDTYSSLSASASTTEVIYEIKGVATFSADGTFILRAKSALTASMNILAGSWMEYDLDG